MKKNVIIIYGGKSCEHDISIITALHCYNSIQLKDCKKHLVYFWNGKFFIGEKLCNLYTYKKFNTKSFDEVVFSKGAIYQKKGKAKLFCNIDCAVLCTHGGEGENGALQGFLEINEVPYTSSKIFESSAFMDKIKTKKMLENYHYKVVPYIVYKENTEKNFQNVLKKFSFPFIVKPANLGSSIGISKVNNESEFKKGIELAFMYDSSIIIEEYLDDNIEINCAAFKKENNIIVSTLERPISESDFLSYEEKYVNGVKYNIKKEFPADIDEKLSNRIKNITKNIYKDFGFAGVVRIDFLIKNNEIYVNEINTIPGSLAFYLFSLQGISYSQIVETMIDEAIKEKHKSEGLINSFCSNVLSNYKGGKNCEDIKGTKLK